MKNVCLKSAFFWTVSRMCCLCTFLREIVKLANVPNIRYEHEAWKWNMSPSKYQRVEISQVQNKSILTTFTKFRRAAYKIRWSELVFWSESGFGFWFAEIDPSRNYYTLGSFVSFMQFIGPIARISSRWVCQKNFEFPKTRKRQNASK